MGFLQIPMNSVNKSKNNQLDVSHLLPLDSKKESVFVEISSATANKRKIRSLHQEVQRTSFAIKMTTTLSYLFSGRSQLFFSTTISHVQVHDILPHTWKLGCLAFTTTTHHATRTLDCTIGKWHRTPTLDDFRLLLGINQILPCELSESSADNNSQFETS